MRFDTGRPDALGFIECFAQVADRMKKPNRNAENHYQIGTEHQNGIFILTKMPFAGCLHHH
jgi:hypothetical protein